LGARNTFAYAYDNNGRLESVTKNSAPYSNYFYDDNGNRINGKHGTSSFAATYDNQDRLLTYNSVGYSYNSTGDNTGVQWNIVAQSTFNYDVLGNLVGAANQNGNVLSFKYDGLNRLVQTDVDGATLSRRIYEDDYRIMAQYSNSGSDLKEFIYATSINSPDYMIFAGSNYRFVKDHLGSPRLIVKSDDGTVVQRLDYTDLGKIIVNTAPSFQPFAFAGGIHEEFTKLVKFGERYYDPEVGRWTRKDPILFNGGDSNLYNYVAGDPINAFDPTGLKIVFHGDAKRQLQRYFDIIKSTATGAKLISQLENSDKTFDIYTNCEKIIRGGTYGGGGGMVDIDLNYHPLLMMNVGLKPAGTTRSLAHELGHAAGADDDGVGKMNNVNTWENPIMRELGGWTRVSYE